jgi:hypothetical protein
MDVDSYEWLEAIDQHPRLTSEDVLAAYHHLGVETELTEQQLDESTFRLQLAGFLWPVAISDDGRTYTYQAQIPKVAA